MFQFPRFPSHKLCIHLWILTHYSKWVSPFGYHRIVAYLRLPDAFRSSSRPSSSSIAKAFTMRPYSFNHLNFSYLMSFEFLISNFLDYSFFSLSCFQRTKLESSEVLSKLSKIVALFLGKISFHCLFPLLTAFFSIFSIERR